jgi:alpha-tubulin suppressor-like RCC1 family protein
LHRFLFADCNVVASWGRGEDGQLGHGDAEQVDAPKAVHALLGADVSAVCCGAEYTVAVSKQHQRVYSWGW